VDQKFNGRLITVTLIVSRGHPNTERAPYYAKKKITSKTVRQRVHVRERTFSGKNLAETREERGGGDLQLLFCMLMWSFGLFNAECLMRDYRRAGVCQSNKSVHDFSQVWRIHVLFRNLQIFGFVLSCVTSANQKS
jgi:hypothetical protein